MRLTAKNVAALVLPEGKAEHFEYDDAIPGFALRLRSGGARTWIFRYRIAGRRPSYSIGSAAAISATRAREIATELYARVKLGQDPAGDKVEARLRAGETFEATLRNYLTRKQSEVRPGTFANIERHLMKHSRSLHRVELARIDQRSIANLLNKITASSGPSECNHVRASLEGFFDWARGEALFVGDNPVSPTNRAVVAGPRSHVPSDADVLAIWNAARDDDFGDIVRLLLLSAARRTEIGSLAFDEIDLDAGVIHLPPERAKTATGRDIYLCPAAVQILRARPRIAGREFVFGSGAAGFKGWARAKANLDKRAGITGWTLHDTRRYFSTVMNNEGIALPHVIEAALGHVVSSKIEGVYNLAAYTAQVRTAVDLWGERMMRLVSGEAPPDKIRQLRQRRTVAPKETAA